MENYFHPELRGSSSEKPSRAREQVTKFQKSLRLLMVKIGQASCKTGEDLHCTLIFLFCQYKKPTRRYRRKESLRLERSRT